MRSISVEANIQDQVPPWHHRQLPAAQALDQKLEIPGMAVPPAGTLDLLAKLGHHSWMGHLNPFLMGANLRDAQSVGIPGALPSGPTPARDSAAEGVLAVDTRKSGHVGSGNQCDPFVVPIPFEHNGGIPEKRRRRQTVILQDDAFFGPAKKPLDGRADGLAATQVLIEESGFDDARPIDQVDDVADFGDQSRFPWLVRSRPVAGDEKPGWPSRADSREDA